MASNLPPTIVASKAANSSKVTASSGQSSPAQSQAGSVASGDNYPQRRSGGGSGVSRASPTPRNNQHQRKQHKGSKRLPRLGNEDALAESLAMRSSNSRKGQTSITHLMNISLAPRPIHHNLGHGRNNRRAPTWGLGSGYHAVDKARYVHANYRFIVDPRTDCHVQSVDADVHLDWNDIMQILVSSKSQMGSCPICLNDPVAPRMAKCGHIFCLPCLIRFMHAEDDSKRPEKKARSKKCPICEDTIYTSDTRPVRWYAGQEADQPPREGGDVVLRLVKRSAGSTLALPRDGATALSKDKDVPWYFAAEAMDYARIMKGSEEYMTAQLDGDIQAVETQGEHDLLMFPEDTTEWTRHAIRVIKEAKEKIKGVGGPSSMFGEAAQSKTERPPIQFSDANDLPEMYAVRHTANSSQVQSGNNITAAPTGISDVSSGSPASSDPLLIQARTRGPSQGNGAPAEYYFYQALLHYYLSPLDIRILREAFGHFSSFPATILPRVERVSTGHVIDDELRKRTKYLSHLPYGCEVNFLECDWTDTVAPEILEKFKPEVERRRKRNEDKEAVEERARLNAEKEEEKRYAHLRRRRPETSSNEWLAAEDFHPLHATENGDGDSSSSSPPWATQRQGSSFASLASISTSPSTSRTVWGTTAIVPSSPPMIAIPVELEPADDGWLQGWEKDLLQEDNLVAQAQAMSLGESSKAGAANGTIGGKKKKAKKITLMTTNVRRGA